MQSLEFDPYHSGGASVPSTSFCLIHISCAFSKSFWNHRQIFITKLCAHKENLCQGTFLQLIQSSQNDHGPFEGTRVLSTVTKTILKMFLKISYVIYYNLEYAQGKLITPLFSKTKKK